MDHLAQSRRRFVRHVRRCAGCDPSCPIRRGLHLAITGDDPPPNLTSPYRK